MEHEMLRLGVYSCVADLYAKFPESIDVSFRTNGRLITRTFGLSRVLIPEKNETEVLLKMRAHFFLDAHFRKFPGRWDTLLDLNDIRLSPPCHEEDYRCTHVNGRCMKAACYRVWELPQPASMDEIIKGVRTLLQRLKRAKQPRGVNAWLRRMTPRRWELPLEYVQ